MDLVRYPEYKDSGIDWIGKIPENWEIEKLKNISQVKPSNVDKKSKDNEPPVLLCNYTDVYNNEFITMNLDFMKATASHDQIRKLSLDIDDIIITKDSESADDIAVPAIVSEKLNNVVCGYHLAVIHPNTNNIYPKFLFRSLESDKINKQFEHGANGVTRFGLGTYPINNAYICMPPLTEQKQIANYLDNKIAKIDKTIENNQKLIELLEEKRVALINQVVTKGLNPDAEMKDSGVEWIGEIPEHWNIEKIKTISQVKLSNVDKKSKVNEPPILLCNYTDVYNNEFITMDLDFMKATASYDQIRKLSLDVGDIIITKDSESADDIAVPAIVSEELDNVVCGYHLAVIQANTNIIYPKFLFRSFESDEINKQFEYGANGFTRVGLGLYAINNAYVCVPPLFEQKEIANYLDKEISNIIKAIAKIKEHTVLLEEYKESLIYHVVTGKIDVRGEDI